MTTENQTANIYTPNSMRKILIEKYRLPLVVAHSVMPKS